MWPTIVLDPSLISVPNIANSRDEAEAIILRIIDWSKYAFDSGAIRLGIMGDTVSALSSANCFPSTSNLSALLELFSLSSVYSVGDIRKQINSILSRCMQISDTLGIEVVDSYDLQVHPDIGASYPDPRIFDVAGRALLSLGAATSYRTHPEPVPEICTGR